MAEYIEKEALLLRIDLHGTNKFGMLDEDIREFIKEQPAADVVQVVRCKECRRAEKDHLFGGYWCHGYRVSPDGFCSYGERKEERNDKK